MVRYAVAATAPTAIAATCEMIDKRKVDRQAAPTLPEQLLSPILLALRASRTEMRDMASIPRSRSKNRLKQKYHRGGRTSSPPRSDGRHAAAMNGFVGSLNFFGKSGEIISTRRVAPWPALQFRASYSPGTILGAMIASRCSGR